MEKINWTLFNGIAEKSKHSICKGEEQTLNEHQIAEINQSLEMAHYHLNVVQRLFNRARKDFGQFPEIKI